MTDSPGTGVPPREGVTILTTCAHHGARGYCNLRVRKDGGEITLDPHVDGGCVIVLDEAAAIQLHELLGTWLG